MNIPTKRQLSFLRWVKDQVLGVENKAARDIGLSTTESFKNFLEELILQKLTIEELTEILKSQRTVSNIPAQQKMQLK